MELEELLKQWRQEALVLDNNGFEREASVKRKMCNEVEMVAADYLTWLDEPNAQVYAGKSVGWLRDHFSKWERAGHARKRGTTRQYRRIVLPAREHVEDIAA